MHFSTDKEPCQSKLGIALGLNSLPIPLQYIKHSALALKKAFYWLINSIVARTLHNISEKTIFLPPRFTVYRANVQFLMFWSVAMVDFESNKKVESGQGIKPIKLITLCAFYQNHCHMKFRCTNRLNFHIFIMTFSLVRRGS